MGAVLQTNPVNGIFIMYKSHIYRLYPTDTQKGLLEKHFGCARFIYNLALETKIECYKKGVVLSAYDLSKQLTDLKKEFTWLNEVSRRCLDQSIFNLDYAYKVFFRGGGFPKFKNKAVDNSFTVVKEVKVTDNKIHVAKFMSGIRCVLHRPISGDIKSITISKTATGKYYASVLFKFEVAHLPKNDNIVGIDLGIKTFATLSNGKVYENPKHLRKSLDRVKILQRRASRKKKGSANRRKANLRVALIYEKITNQRVDFLHRVSNEITNQNGTICIEDLAVGNMLKNHCLSLSIKDASWATFTSMLKYKSVWRGRELIKISRFEPTSKKCSGCGAIQDMPLSERLYTCSCGLSIDRDLNASINIKNSGLLRAGVPMELLTIVGAVK